MMLTKTNPSLARGRKPPELRQTMVVEPYQEARDAMTRISTRDAQIAPLAKMNREDWLVIGKALSEIRSKHASDKEYGQAVREAGLDQGCCSGLESRRDCLWYYENSTRVYTLVESTNLNHPNAIRRYIRGLDAEPKPEAPTIKVATTEHPIVKSDRPKCPGVEGIGPGCWRWSEAWGEWEQQAPHVEQKPSRPPCPGVEGSEHGQYVWFEKLGWSQNHFTTSNEGGQEASKAQGVRLVKSARDWIKDYVAFCKEDTITAILETIRRQEHPDRGGSTEITVVLNQYITERKQA